MGDGLGNDLRRAAASARRFAVPDRQQDIASRQDHLARPFMGGGRPARTVAPSGQFKHIRRSIDPRGQFAGLGSVEVPYIFPMRER